MENEEPSKVNDSEDTMPLLKNDGITLNEDVANRKWLYWLCFFIIGTVTNLGYVMVGTAAADLAEIFSKEDLMPMFQLCLIGISAVVKFVNSKFLIGMSHKKRIYFNVCLQIASYALISIVTIIPPYEVGFWLSLVASIMHGTTSGLGESTTLAMIRGFPSILIGAFSSGTGMSGILSTSTLLLFKSITFFEEHEGYIFVIMSSTILAYFFSFVFLFRQKRSLEFEEERERAKSGSVASMIEAELTQAEDQNVNMNFESFKFIVSRVGFWIFCLWTVYFFEYCCTTAFANAFTLKMKDKSESKSGWLYSNGFIVFCFCYQAGVFLSRSSLEIVKVRKVWILSLIQLVNFVWWWLNTEFFWVQNYYVMFVVQVWTGLMGGAAYVNVLYQIRNSDKLPTRYKELGVMVCTIFNDFSIFTASVVSLILTNTEFKGLAD